MKFILTSSAHVKNRETTFPESMRSYYLFSVNMNNCYAFLVCTASVNVSDELSNG
jgi:hypothetical protein